MISRRIKGISTHVFMWVVCCCGLFNAIRAEIWLPVSPETDRISLHSALGLRLDTEESGISESFISLEEVETTTLQSKDHWLRLRVDFSGKDSVQMWLNIAYFSEIEVYRRAERGEDLLDVKGRAEVIKAERVGQVYRTRLIPLTLYPGRQTLYFHLAAPSRLIRFLAPMSFSQGFDLLSDDAVKWTFFSQRKLSYLLSGGLLFVFFLNSLLAIRTRERVYIYLAIYNLLFCLTYLNSNSLWLALGWIDDREMVYLLHLIFPFLVFAANNMFGFSFLEMEKYAPRVHRIGLMVLLLLVPVAFLYWFGYFTIPLIGFILIAINQFFVLAYGLKINYQDISKRRHLKLFVAGSTILLVFTINFILSIALSHWDYYFHELLLEGAGGLEILLFTYITVDKFAAIRHQAATLTDTNRSLHDQQRQMEEEIADKNKELVARTTAEFHLRQQQEEIIALLNAIENEPQARQAIRKVRQMQDYSSFEESFLTHFNGVHPGFIAKLQDKHPRLSATDLRICAYLKMNLDSAEIARIQGVEKASINQTRYRIRKKMDLPKGSDLFAYLHTI